MGDAFNTIVCRHDLLDVPRQQLVPRNYFVSDDGDLLHEDVPQEFIDSVIATMRDTPQHSYLVCTKRPARLQQDWPPNAWVGVSAEDQRTFDERTPALQAVSGVSRFVSLQPLLAPVSVKSAPWLDWVAAGGEYGANTQTVPDDWMRSLRDECKAAGTCFTYQQNTVSGVRIMFPKLDGVHHSSSPATLKG